MATDSAKTNAILRSLLLALLLTASVAAALGYTTYLRGRGGRFVEELRRRGMAEFYPAEPTQMWYQQTRRKEDLLLLLGWRAFTLATDPETGRFHGTNISYNTVSGVGSWERWQLNQDATESVYHAGQFTSVDGACQMQMTTAIRLADGRITALQRIEGHIHRSVAEAPGNYLPEGTTHAATQMMMDHRGRTTFSMIMNTIPPKDGRPQFAQMSLGKVTQAAPAVPGAAAVMRSLLRMPNGQTGSLLFFNAGRQQIGGIFSTYEEQLLPAQQHGMLFRQPEEAICQAVDAASQYTVQQAAQDDNWQFDPPEESPAD